MAGYSGRPLVQKLGVKANARAVIAGAPDDFLKQLESAPGRSEIPDAGCKEI